MKRRTFLRHATHSLAIPGIVGSLGFSGAHARSLASFLRFASETDKVLVLIYLQGGNDGLNTVIPLDQIPALTMVRPHVVLPANKLVPLSNLSNVALHPALSGFRSLYGEGRLGIVQSVGYSDQSYSHFRSTDIWMSGSGSHELVNSGWTGRYLSKGYPTYPTDYPNETTPHPLAIELGYGASLLFQGPVAAMSTVINNPESFYQLIENADEEAPDTDAGAKLKYIRLIARQSQQYGKVLKEAAEHVQTQGYYPDNNYLAQQLKIVAKLIAGGLKTSLYLVRIGGFDTHNEQVVASDHTQGRHAELLGELDRAVMSFMQDLDYLGIDDKVVGMTFSEFGRRIVSNASLGTDHGSASPIFVFGNQVRGGVLGGNPVISPYATYADNLEKQFDFRQVYASLLEQWFGSPTGEIADVMLGDFETLPLIGKDSVGLKEAFSVYPNPIQDHATIEFVSAGGAVDIEVIDMSGRRVEHVYAGSLPVGGHSLSWNTGSLNAGRYFVVVHGKDQKQVKSVIKL